MLFLISLCIVYLKSKFRNHVISAAFDVSSWTRFVLCSHLFAEIPFDCSIYFITLSGFSLNDLFGFCGSLPFFVFAVAISVKMTHCSLYTGYFHSLSVSLILFCFFLMPHSYIRN